MTKKSQKQASVESTTAESESVAPPTTTAANNLPEATIKKRLVPLVVSGAMLGSWLLFLVYVSYSIHYLGQQ